MTYAVKFDNVTKRYSRGGPRYASLRHDLSGAVDRLGQRLRGRRVEPRGTLALDDVSFEVEEGESFAIIGPNGAGKTTALKLISRISYPTRGEVRVRGRVGALIEVGSGIHPELTARENIWLYGRILGMGRATVGRRFDEIVEFAELGQVLDRPVKMYSTGMQLRLGFAIASHLDPDVFVVDEALAVGDAGFQTKCVERMTKLVSEGRTLLFVSHNLHAVETVCQRGICLDAGRVRDYGTAREVIGRYVTRVEDLRAQSAKTIQQEGYVRLLSATCHSLDGEERYQFETGDGLVVRLHFKCDRPLERPLINLGITDGRPGLLVQCSMLNDGQAPEQVGLDWECRCRIESLPLRPRLYEIYCDIYNPQGHGTLMNWVQATSFRVKGEVGAGPMAVVNSALAGALDIPYSWEIVGTIQGDMAESRERYAR